MYGTKTKIAKMWQFVKSHMSTSNAKANEILWTLICSGEGQAWRSLLDLRQCQARTGTNVRIMTKNNAFICSVCFTKGCHLMQNEPWMRGRIFLSWSKASVQAITRKILNESENIFMILKRHVYLIFTHSYYYLYIFFRKGKRAYQAVLNNNYLYHIFL